MSKSLLFQIVKQILVNLVIHHFYERRFLANGTSFPPPRDTQLPFDMLFITIFYTCHVTEVVYHRGEQLRIRKNLKLYIVFYRSTMKNIKSRWIRFGTYKQPWYQQIWCFLYSINANFDSNVLVEQMLKILGKDARFLVKCPYKMTNDKETTKRHHQKVRLQLWTDL